METKLHDHLNNLKWKIRLVENQIMTAQKLEFRCEVLYLQRMKEIYQESIFTIENIIDENKKK